MDPTPLVASQIDEGQRLLDRLASSGVEVAAAGWLLLPENDRWLLHVATPIYEDKGPREAIVAVLDAFQSAVPAIDFGSDEMRIVGAKTRFASDAQEHFRSHPDGTKLRPTSSYFGGMGISDAYLYPLHKRRFTIYGTAIGDGPIRGLMLSFDKPNPGILDDSNSPNEIRREGGHDFEIEAPHDALLIRSPNRGRILRRNRNGKFTDYDANEVWTLAKHSLHGFRMLNPGEEEIPSPSLPIATALPPR